MRARLPLAAILTLGLLACDGSVGDRPAGAGAASGAGAGAPTGTGPASGSATGAGGASASSGSSGGGAPPCTAVTLADSVRTTSVTIAGAASSRAMTAETASGSFAAWLGTDGSVHATPLDAIDERAGDDIVVEGTQVFGAAAASDGVALLVSRAPDYMTFVHAGTGGAIVAKSDLVGGGDHDVEGTEWFGEFATTGRLVGRADGTFAAYHALHRHWPDGIGHQGDTLRLLDPTGAALGGGWDWGCSHSIDQRIAVDAAIDLVPVCVADCYPGKGIYFNHSAAEITPDPLANCAGSVSTLVGGLVAQSDGFFLVYQDTMGGAHLGRFDAGGKSLADRSLGVSGASRLARYDDGLLLGSDAGGTASLQRLDASGQDSGPATTVTAALPDQDFESRSDGEVAWATASGTTLTVVRVRICN